MKGKSTVTATATILDEISNKLENSEDTATIILDQSAAYDVIPHKILLKKMKILGFQQPTIEYFKSYFFQQKSNYVSGWTFIQRTLHMTHVSGSGKYIVMYHVHDICHGPPSTLPPHKLNNPTTSRIQPPISSHFH